MTGAVRRKPEPERSYETLAEVRARIKEIEAELAEAGDDTAPAPTRH